MHRQTTLLLILAFVATATAAEGQTSEQLRNGSRVANATISASNPIVLVRGDSTTLTVGFTDSDGEEVDNLFWGLDGNTDILAVRAIGDARSTRSFSIRAAHSGTRSFMISVRDYDEDGEPRLRLVDSLTIEVSDWPVASIRLDDPPATVYTGTSFRLSGDPITSHGTVHETATIDWSSETTGIAAVTRDGVVTLFEPGRAVLVASAGDFSESIEFDVTENPVRQVTISPAAIEVETGEVAHFEALALDARGRVVTDIDIAFSVHSLDSAGAQVFDDGAFVAENPGEYEVIVTAGDYAARALVHAGPRQPSQRVELVGRGSLSHVATSDLWVFEGSDGRDYAYTGTHSQGGGERMFVWDVTDPADVMLVDSVVVDARVVNDVKINGAATWAIITREGASSRRNGIVVLDIAEPAHPVILAELTDNMTSGIHNVWINGDVVYAINDGTNALDIVDMSDPANPRYHGNWEIRPGETNKNLHDIWSDGRYAYLSYWDDGLVILDVGAGTHGGTPLDPAFVSVIAYDMGNTHTAWREGDYVFVGDEIFGCEECINGPRGYIHVIDVSDIDSPVEVAKYHVPEAGTHNIWVENGILYVAYYQGGLRIIDVSGELRGDLYKQGREIGWYHTAAAEDEGVVANAPLAWGPQPFKGNIFVTDMNSGLWVLHHESSERLSQ